MKKLTANIQLLQDFVDSVVGTFVCKIFRESLCTFAIYLAMQNYTTQALCLPLDCVLIIDVGLLCEVLVAKREREREREGERERERNKTRTRNYLHSILNPFL